MKTLSTTEVEAKGVNQRYLAPPNAASDIRGFFHVDPSGGGWVNDRGIEPLIPYTSPVVFTTSTITSLLQPVRFLAVIPRHNSAEVYYLYEQDGTLQYDMGNIGTTTGIRGKSILDTGRKIPKPDDPGTQISTYGRFNLLINGTNDMLKWWGRESVSNFGFVSPTPSPGIADIKTDYIAWQDGADVPPSFYNRLTNGQNCFRLPSSGYYGLGDPEVGDVNRYDYKISFISDTGSESPLSSPTTVAWTISDKTFATTGNRGQYAKYAEGKYGVYFTDLPLGPKGTVARRIYRTKNRKDGLTGAGEIYYFVKQVDNNADRNPVDISPDQDLNVVAPSVDDSVTISSQWKYCATFNNSMWLGGGEMNPFGIIFSKPGFPEQFGAFDTFDVGLREGGAITALVPFYDVMLVFRERSIELISYNNGSYAISTLDSNVGTTATNTIRIVAGLGVLFLNKDGVFSISGSIRGGSVYSLAKISDPIEPEMGRVSLSALPRATATYSEREKEYWVHYPVDGDTENSRGSCFSTLNNQWSFRFLSGLYENGEGMPYTQMATDPNGWIILGLKSKVTADSSGRRGYPGFGLQVWSGSPFAGATLANPVVNPQAGTTTFDIQGIAKTKDVWESTWNDFGDSSKKKRVIYVEVEVITSGENPIELEYATDWGYTFTSAGTQIPLRSEVVGTVLSEATYGTSGGNPAIWNTSAWSQAQVTRLRWDVSTGLISQFKFRVSSANILQVLSFQTEVVGSQNKVINQTPQGVKI